MKIQKTIPILLFFFAISTFAQPRLKEKKEQIKALKVAYITEELQLTSEEATKFWPIYNAYEDKQKELRQEKMRSYMNRLDAGEVDAMNEKEAANLLNQIESTEDDLYQLRKKFIVSLKGILPAKKIIKLKRSEEGFNRKLLKQYREKIMKD
jgi:Spy/CpxP family protein refolding chaperone